MADTQNPISWEDGYEEGEMISECGEYVARMDPVYGYWKLHTFEDTVDSLAEDMSLLALARHAEAHRANPKAYA